MFVRHVCRSFGTDEDLLIVPCLTSAQNGATSFGLDNSVAESGVDQDVQGGKALQGQSHLTEVPISLPAGINLRSKASRVATSY